MFIRAVCLFVVTIFLFQNHALAAKGGRWGSDEPGGKKKKTTAVIDGTAPELSLPGNLVFEATSGNGAYGNYSVSAWDDVDGSVAVSCQPASGSLFPLHETAVNCSATDSSGNVSSGSFIVNVTDSRPPVLQLPAGLQAESSNGSALSLAYQVAASDSVDASPSLSCSPASGASFAIGSTNVSCLAEDDFGNQASGSFLVTVIDTSEPEPTPEPDPVPEPDPEQPLVSISSVDGSLALTAGDSFGVVATAQTGNGNIEYCDLYWNGASVRQEVNAPYTWGTATSSKDPVMRNLAAGSYTAMAACIDSAGMVGSASFVVTVAEAETDPVAPSVSISSVGGSLALNEGDSFGVVATAQTENGTIEYCDLYWNGASVRQEVNAPYTWGTATSSKDPVMRNLAAGSYTAMAACVDSAGLISSDSFTVVVAGGDSDPEPQVYTANVQWQIPTQRTDGTPLAVDDIDSYSLVYDESSSLVSGEVVSFPARDGNGKLIDSYPVSLGAAGTYYLTMVVQDTQGNLSEIAEPIVVTVQ